jgi:hypothetical protein
MGNLNSQLDALNNAVNSAPIDGLKIHHKYFEDKRKRTPKFFLMLNGASISPVLDYTNMNHFILGLGRGVTISGTLNKATT